MVDYPHLSEGNSLSSPSRDLSVEFGNSIPTDNSCSNEDMVESVAVPSQVDLGSSDSDTVREEVFGPLAESQVRDIFKAAHHFSQTDRIDVIAERKKNQDLMSFISAHGLSINDVNEFINKGSVHGPASRNVDEHDMFMKSSLKRGDSSPSPSMPPEARATPLLDLTSGSQPPLSAARVPSLTDGPSSPLSGRTLKEPHPTILVGSAALPEVAPKSLSSCPGAPSAIGERSNLKSWSSLLTPVTPPKLNLSFFPPNPSPSSSLDSVIIQPPLDVLRKGSNNWNSSLIGHFLHSKLPYKVVEQAAMRLWG